MTVQPCGCGSHESDWPYSFSSEDENGLLCGLDENGDTIMWVEPSGDVGAFYATKDEAAGIANGTGPDYDFQNFGAMSVRAGDAYFDGTNTFEAVREGMYLVTFKAVLDWQNPEDMDIYLKVQSDYAPWATSNHSGSPGASGDSGPFLYGHDACVAFLGGAVTISGELPCLEGGTLTYGVLHNAAGTKAFHDIIMAASWRSPIPT